MDPAAAIRHRLQITIIDMDRLSRPTPPKPGDPNGFASAEQELGLGLPPLLRRLYAEIGNGGFGPGYGLIGLTNGVPDDTGRTAPAIYKESRGEDPDDPAWQWPEALLPICHWGCAIVSCIDCIDTSFRMRIFDPNVFDKDWRDCFFEESRCLRTLDRGVGCGSRPVGLDVRHGGAHRADLEDQTSGPLLRRPRRPSDGGPGGTRTHEAYAAA